MSSFGRHTLHHLVFCPQYKISPLFLLSCRVNFPLFLFHFSLFLLAAPFPPSLPLPPSLPRLPLCHHTAVPNPPPYATLSSHMGEHALAVGFRERESENKREKQDRRLSGNNIRKWPCSHVSHVTSTCLAILLIPFLLTLLLCLSFFFLLYHNLVEISLLLSLSLTPPLFGRFPFPWLDCSPAPI